MYFAFYYGPQEDPARTYEGFISLRGLEERMYQVRDYIRDQEIGIVSGPIAQMAANFDGYWLLEAIPLN
jgi:hypothetical protein